MSTLKNALAVASAVAMIATPVAASAAPATKPVSAARVSAPVSQDKSKLAGNLWIIFFALAAAGLGVGAASSGGSSANSPG